MAESLLSEGERTFIIHGIEQSLRTDGRGCTDYRPIDLEIDVVPNTNGSARVKLANTDVIVGVKAELDSPLLPTPDDGRLEFFIDCSAIATPEFEGRGGEKLATEVSSLLQRAYGSPSVVDTRTLCLPLVKKCWVLHVDILILECGGSIYDAVSMAVKAALHTTKIPKILLNELENGQTEIELSDDPYEFDKIDVQNAPILVTVAKIGNLFVLDPSADEEACSLSCLIVAVRPTSDSEAGSVTAVRKVGSGSLQPESIADMLKSGVQVGSILNEKLMMKLNQDSNHQPDGARSSGFLL